MGTNMMGSWGWAQMWYYWLIPLAVIALTTWLIIRIANRNRGRQG